MSSGRYDHHALSSKDIAQLIAVADSGSIRRAAEALGMTQPGLSKNIRLIEERLGVCVFERSTTGAVPTTSGLLLLRRGRQILLDLQAIHRELKQDQLADKGVVRVGCGAVPAPVIAAEAVPRALAAYPGIKVELEVDYPGHLIEALVRGDYDFVICTGDGMALPDGLSATLLLTVVPLVFARKGHPLADATGLTMASLAGWKLATIQTHSPFDAWLADAVGLPGLEVGFQCDDFELLGRVVEKSDMLCMTSDTVFRQLQRGLDIVPLAVADIDLSHRISCIQPGSRGLSGPAAKILAIMKAALAES